MNKCIMYKCIMYKCIMNKCIMYKCIINKRIMYKCINVYCTNLSPPLSHVSQRILHQYRPPDSPGVVHVKRDIFHITTTYWRKHMQLSKIELYWLSKPVTNSKHPILQASGPVYTYKNYLTDKQKFIIDAKSHPNPPPYLKLCGVCLQQEDSILHRIYEYTQFTIWQM